MVDTINAARNCIAVQQRARGALACPPAAPLDETRSSAAWPPLFKLQLRFAPQKLMAVPNTAAYVEKEQATVNTATRELVQPGPAAVCLPASSVVTLATSPNW